MAQVINTNVMSLNAQRNLNSSQSTMQVALQRLSSGLRINSAKDDAAGLAIANRMTSQIQGMDQAARNANDGISLAQTGESALQQITNNLHRMRQLAVQSRNSTNTSTDRTSLDSEFQQLLAENDRLAQVTAFNGRNILDGSFGTSEFQVGANVGETISVNVSSSMRTGSVGNYAVANLSMADYDDPLAATSTADTNTVDADGEIVINSTNVQTIATEGNGKDQGSAYLIAKMINQHTDTTGVTAKAGSNSQTFTSAQIGGFVALNDNATNADTLTYTVAVNGTTVLTHSEGDSALSAAELANRFNNVSSTTGVTATVTSTGGMTLTASDGRNISIQQTLGGATDNADSVTGYFGDALTGNNQDQKLDVYKGSVELSSASSITYSTNTAGSALFTGVTDDGTSYSAQTAALSTSSITSTTNADSSIYRIDQALSDVDVLRGTFGAIQSRFESTVASLAAASENLSAARSRIQDADFAMETAALTKAQILQQAGVAMVSQANALPQTVLSLLG